MRKVKYAQKSAQNSETRGKVVIHRKAKQRKEKLSAKDAFFLV